MMSKPLNLAVHDNLFYLYPTRRLGRTARAENTGGSLWRNYEANNGMTVRRHPSPQEHSLIRRWAGTGKPVSGEHPGRAE